MIRVGLQSCHSYYKKDHSCYENLSPRLIPFWNLCATGQCKADVRADDGRPTYLNKLLVNDALNDDLLRNFQAVERVLSHPACQIVQQLQFDLDLIEVSNGFWFSISKREFVPKTIPSSKIGKVSLRAFLKYDCSTPPQPQYF